MNPSLEETRDTARRVVDEVERAIVGKREVVELVMASILSGGHVLLEDVPGVAKTLMARSFASALGVGFKRIQFTPDLLPMDITGSFIYDQKEGTFEFRRGPVFTNLLLADEINRATPKTQAALLEAMQEGQVTVEEVTHDLGDPFLVIATQNPIENEGTYPLPEAQLDRFMVRASVGYPDEAGEGEVLRRRLGRGTDEVELEAVTSGQHLVEMQSAVEGVHVDPSITDYIVRIARATRAHPDVAVGASPRGAMSLMKLTRSWALMQGRDFVTPDDVKDCAPVTLSHRLSLRPELWVKKVAALDTVKSVLAATPAPAPAPGPGE